MTDFPDLKLKAMVQFPASVIGGAGIDVVKANGSYTISINYSDFTPPVTSLPAGAMTAVMWNSITNTYYLTPVSAFATSVGIPQNLQSANYTTVADDAQKHLLHPSADTTARTFTIAANASVAYPIGTVITFINQNTAGVLTIAVISDIMRLAGAGTTGNRTLAANGVATALKIATAEWIISGTGLT
jgi:hypothetical protein